MDYNDRSIYSVREVVIDEHQPANIIIRDDYFNTELEHYQFFQMMFTTRATKIVLMSTTASITTILFIKIKRESSFIIINMILIFIFPLFFTFPRW